MNLMERSVILIIIVVTFSVHGFADEYKYAKISAGREQITQLSEKGFDVIRESIRNLGEIYSFQVYVTDMQIIELRDMGYELEVITDERTKEEKTKGYHTNVSIGSELDSLQTAYPDLCKRIQVGTSVQGRPLWAIKISDNVNDDENEPEFKFSSTIHGDEVVGMEMCMELIYDVIEGYLAENDTMTYIVNETELFVLPLHNPDGNEAGSRNNANGVDLNRSFPERIYDQTNTTSGKQPEVAAMINWNNERKFVMSANFHGGAIVANYPWDADPVYNSGQYAPCPDDSHFVFISRGYADRNPAMVDFDNGITNGCEWYEITGGMQDWNYHYYGAMDVTMEISYTKWPAYSSIPSYWADNRSSMFWYLMSVHRGVKGIVTSRLGEFTAPVEATLRFDGIDKDYLSDSVTGEYFKILKPGIYNLNVTAYGCEPMYITNIEVKDSLATILNIELATVGIEEDDSNLPYGITLEQNYPNPFNPVTTINFTLESDEFVKLAVHDNAGAQIAVLGEGLYKKGRHTFEFNGEGLSSGVYHYVLRDSEGRELTKKMLMLK